MDDRIGVPLELEGFEVTGSEVVDGTLEVGVRSTIRPACSGCGSVDVKPYDTTQRRLRDRGCGYPVVLRWAQRRFRCRDCDSIRRERHPQVPGRKRITERFRRRLYEAAIRRPFVGVALDEKVSLYRVVDAFDVHAADELVEPLAHQPRVISMDESAFRKRHRYHTVFSDPEKGVTFDLTSGRDKGAAAAGLLALSDQVRANVEVVVIDCHWPYRRVIEHLLPRALLVADKFHVIKAVDAAADRIRKKHGRRRTVIGRDGGLSRQHNPRFVPQVWRGRWAFMKRNSKLTDDEGDALEWVFERIPEIGVAWLMKEAFAAIYDAPDRAEAKRRLEVWVHHLDVCGLREFKGVWRTLQWWEEQILSYFDDRVTNGFAEGITNKIKATKRAAFGFRDPVRYRHKVLLACGYRRAKTAASHRLS